MLSDIIQSCCSCIPQRYVLSLSACFGVAIVYMLRNCLSMAITEMIMEPLKKNTTVSVNACPDIPSNNGTIEHGNGEFDWSEKIQGYILGSFYYGYGITHIPGGLVADKLGGKHVFGGGILITAVCSLFSPFAAEIHYAALIGVRLISGMASGVVFPSANVLLARWAPPNERSRIGALVFAGAQIGNVVSYNISGLILQYFGWVSVFYFFGTFGVVWYIIWFILCYSDPATHPFISEEERMFLITSIPGLSDRSNIQMTPFLRILTSCPVWALILCQFGHNWGLFTMQNSLPKYLKSVLRYSSAENGFLSSLPFLAVWISAILGGIISDIITKNQILSTVVTRKILTLISQVGPGCGCLAAVYAGCDRTLVVALFIIGMALMGPFFPSTKVNALDLAPNYAGFLMALINGIGAYAGSLCSQVVGYFVKDNTFKEWLTVFWLSNFIMSSTGVWYCLFGSAELQSWNYAGQEARTPS